MSLQPGDSNWSVLWFQILWDVVQEFVTLAFLHLWQPIAGVPSNSAFIFQLVCLCMHSMVSIPTSYLPGTAYTSAAILSLSPPSPPEQVRPRFHSPAVSDKSLSRNLWLQASKKQFQRVGLLLWLLTCILLSSLMNSIFHSHMTTYHANLNSYLLWLFLTATAAQKRLPDNKALKQSSSLQVFLSTALIKEVQSDE